MREELKNIISKYFYNSDLKTIEELYKEYNKSKLTNCLIPSIFNVKISRLSESTSSKFSISSNDSRSDFFDSS